MIPHDKDDVRPEVRTDAVLIEEMIRTTSWLSAAIECLQEDRFMGLIEIADYLDAKPATVYKWRARGLLPSPDLRVSGRPAWRASTIDAWVVATNRPLGPAPLLRQPDSEVV